MTYYFELLFRNYYSVKKVATEAQKAQVMPAAKPLRCVCAARSDTRLWDALLAF